MMASDFIVDVTEADFESKVLAYSHKVPVVVDFWAEWCAPCRTLGPILEKLAQEAQGGFRLAKVNVDQNPNLAVRYGVHSIPAVKAFRNQEMVNEFAGVQPEPQLREFLRAIAPSQSDLILEKGLSLLEAGDYQEAEKAFRQALDMSPDSTLGMLGLAKSELLQGRGAAAHHILAQFPPSREYSTAEMLRPLSQALSDMENGTAFESDNALEAAYYNALRLVKRNNIEAAMDGLLDILREDKNFLDGKVRLIMVALLELLGDANPTARQYRSELASVLF